MNARRVGMKQHTNTGSSPPLQGTMARNRRPLFGRGRPPVSHIIVFHFVHRQRSTNAWSICSLMVVLDRCMHHLVVKETKQFNARSGIRCRSCCNRIVALMVFPP